MKRRVNKKALAALLAFVMVLFSLVSGTLAYFTDVTEEKENVFTIGKVDISLDEPHWDPDNHGAHIIMPSKKIDKDPTITVDSKSQDCWAFLKVDMNKYMSLINLIGVDAYINGIGGLTGEYPGPAGFLSAMVSDKDLRTTVLERWIQGIDHTAWKVMNLGEITTAIQNNDTHIIIKLGHNDIMQAGNKVTFMTSYTMPETVTQSMLDGDRAYYVGDGDARHSASNFNSDQADFVVTFKAYAIQAAEISDLDTAYGALANLEDANIH